jgi:hypothetical protein
MRPSPTSRRAVFLESPFTSVGRGHPVFRRHVQARLGTRRPTASSWIRPLLIEWELTSSECCQLPMDKASEQRRHYCSFSARMYEGCREARLGVKPGCHLTVKKSVYGLPDAPRARKGELTSPLRSLWPPPQRVGSCIFYAPRPKRRVSASWKSSDVTIC